MANQTFKEALEHGINYAAVINDKEFVGHFANVRIGQNTLPPGWYTLKFGMMNLDIN